MTNVTRTRTSRRKAADWQETFAKNLVEQDEATLSIVGTTGAGKTVAVLTLIQRLRERTPEARIFCAVPASSSQAHFADRLQRWDPYGDVQYASPSWYRRKRASAEDEDGIWGRGKTYVLNDSVLQLSSARESFLNVDWDLGVAEDLDLYDETDDGRGGTRTSMLSVFRSLLASRACKRFVATSREETQPFSRPMDVFRRDETFIKDEGIRLEKKVLTYERSSSEADLHRALDEISEHLDVDARPAPGILDRTYAARRSSLYAIDQWLFHLQRLARVSADAKSATFPGTGRPGDLQRKVQDAARLWKDTAEAQEWIDGLFEKVGAIEKDTKLERLYSFLSETDTDHVCCMTYDAGTAAYLYSDLQENGERVFRIQQKDSLEEIERTQEAFHTEGSEERGVLIVEDAILPDLDLIEADATVHYDLPMRTGTIQRRTSAVIPRQGDALPTYAFRDVSAVSSDDETLLRQYGYVEDEMGT